MALESLIGKPWETTPFIRFVEWESENSKTQKRTEEKRERGQTDL